MSNVKRKVIPYGISGLNLWALPKRLDLGTEMNSAGAFVAIPAADPGIALTADPNDPSAYIFKDDHPLAAAWPDGVGHLYVYECTVGTTKNRAADYLVDVIEYEIVSDQFAAVGASIAAIYEVEDDEVYDADGYKTSSNIYIYNSAANATTHDKATGLVRTDAVTFTYDANKRQTLYKRISA